MKRMLWHATIAPLNTTGVIGTVCGISTDTRICYTGLHHHPTTVWDHVNCPECIAVMSRKSISVRSVCIAWPPENMFIK